MKPGVFHEEPSPGYFAVKSCAINDPQMLIEAYIAQGRT